MVRAPVSDPVTARSKGNPMTQRQLEREVASATGESMTTIRRRGFSLVEPEYPEPLVLDWDDLDAERTSLFPAHYHRLQAA